MKRLVWKHIAGAAAISVLIVMSVVFTHHNGKLAWIDRFLYDLHIRLTATGTVSGDVLLVLMDAESAQQLERQRGGWSRTHLADALDHLCQSGAATVGIDLVLAAPDAIPAVDARLTEAIDDCGNVVLARVSLSGGQTVTPLAPFLNAAAGDGFIDLPPDSDDVLRRVPFFHALPVKDSGVELIPSFSLELARVFRGLPFEPDFSDPDVITMGEAPQTPLRLPYPDLLIRYSGDYRSFDHVSFASVVAGKTDPSLIRGKLVVIGSHLAIEKDYFSTPYTRFNRVGTDISKKFDTVLGGVLSDKDIGMSCQAFAAETILSGNAVRQAPFRVVTMATVGAGIAAGAFYLPALGSLAAAVILGLSIAVTVGVGFLCLSTAGVWVESSPVALVITLQFISGTILQKALQRRRIRWLSALFGKYVSPEVASELMNSDLGETLAGANREVTLLFADLRDFTALSEHLGPVKTRALLNRFFQAIIPVVFNNKGTLDKLMGDAVMAIFGAPLFQENHPDLAADCALEMVAALKVVNAEPVEGARELRMAVGINSGNAIVGNMGTDAFMDYTAIGDTVNLASRLEGLNRYYGTRIILGPEAAHRLHSRFVTRRLDRVRVAGRDAPVDIYELLGTAADCPAALREGLGQYEAALTAYQEGDIDGAQRLATALSCAMPDDGPSRWLIQRIDEAAASPAEFTTPVTDFHLK